VTKKEPSTLALLGDLSSMGNPSQAHYTSPNHTRAEYSTNS
jgi:hypothetical protein